MKAGFIPSVPEISREALTLIAGAILAALIMSRFPQLKAWIKDQAL